MANSLFAKPSRPSPCAHSNRTIEWTITRRLRASGVMPQGFAREAYATSARGKGYRLFINRSEIPEPVRRPQRQWWGPRQPQRQRRRALSQVFGRCLFSALWKTLKIPRSGDDRHIRRNKCLIGIVQNAVVTSSGLNLPNRHPRFSAVTATYQRRCCKEKAFCITGF